MANTILVTVGSLAGVLLGGALSLFAQRAVEHSASRRHAASILEGRRAERLTYLISFIETAQEAERLGIGKHQHGAHGDAMDERTEALLDQLWMKLRAVQLICPAEVSEAARDLAGQVHKVVREGTDGQSVAAFLRPSRAKLFASARADLQRIGSDNELPEV